MAAPLIPSETPSRVCMVYIPCPDEACARDIGRKLVERRLAACANVVPRMVSIYRWEGKIEEDKESLLLLKSIEGNLPEIALALEKLHPYRLPGMAAYPAVGGLPAYLDWVRDGSRSRDP